MKSIYILLLLALACAFVPTTNCNARVVPTNSSVDISSINTLVYLPKKPAKKSQKSKNDQKIKWVLVILGIVLLLISIAAIIWGVFFFQGLFTSLPTNTLAGAVLSMFLVILYIALAILSAVVFSSVISIGIALIMFGVMKKKWMPLKRREPSFE